MTEPSEPAETWDPADVDVFQGRCDRCGAETLVVEAVDPFIREGIVEDDGEGPDLWCQKCLETRQGDV